MRRKYPDLPQLDEAAPWAWGASEGTEASRLVREVCHDLIGPAATIKMLAQAACQEGLPAHPVQDHLALISAEAAKISDVCGHVLGRSRPRTPVRLDRLLEQQVGGMRATYQTRLELELDEVLADVHPAVFLRAVGNLLTNACQAAGAAGLVRVALEADYDRARVRVDDSGPGFTAGGGDRTCYGLQIAWSLVLGSGGTVQMEVSDLGGLRIVVSFPAMPGGGVAESADNDRQPAATAAGRTGLAS